MRSIKPGDAVTLRKAHACGSDRFTVLRTGADVKLECAGCGRVVMLPSDKAARSIKKVDIAAEVKD